MRRVLALVLILGWCSSGAGLEATTGAGTVAGRVSGAGVAPGEGPLARAALRAAAAPLAASTGRQQPRLPETVAAVRESARRMPPGVKVKVRTLTGTRLEGKLLSAGETGVLVETKVGRPPEEVAYETMQSIEKQGGGMPGCGKVLIISGVVVGSLYVIGNCVAAADSGGKKTWCN